MNEEEQEALQQAIAEYEAEQMHEQEAPTPESKDSHFKFMRELLGTKDSTKIGNLTAEELGKSELSLRGYQKVALLANTVGLKEISDYYNAEAEILAASSMSRKSTFLQLIFTQIKKSVTSSEPKPETKGLFGFKKRSETQ